MSNVTKVKCDKGELLCRNLHTVTLTILNACVCNADSWTESENIAYGWKKKKISHQYKQKEPLADSHLKNMTSIFFPF